MFVTGFLLCYPGSYVSANGDTSGEPAVVQQTGKTVTGTVVDVQGEPLIGVSVSVEGTMRGVATDVNGQYSIQVQGDNQVLRFSYIGYKPVTVTANKTPINVTMETNANVLDEVVVTAMGIKKDKKALGYSVQDINSEEILKNKTSNPINSLAGKIAGVNITQAGGAAGSGAQIILRGGTSLERDNQPVFVVDGVIYDNSTSVNGNSAFDGLGSVATTNSNRIMDINPEDIENMSVLKGPAAAALYGSRAAAGVIIITTKKGKEGKTDINFSSKITSSWVNRLPEQQNKYKRGYYTVDGTLNDYTTQSWGAPFSDGDNMYNNIGDFFQTSTIYDNNISIASGNKNGTMYLSVSHFDQTGVVPSTGYDKTAFRFNGDQKYGILTVGASAAYTLSNTDKTLTSAGLWDSGGTGTMNTTYSYARNENMKKYLNDDGTKYRMFEGLQELKDDVENPYWTINKNKLTDHTERFTGSVNLDVKLTNWWNVSYRAGLDTYTTSNYNLIYPGGAVKDLWQDGMMSENETKYTYRSSNLMTNFHQIVSDFDFNLLLGTSTDAIDTDVNRRKGVGFIENDFFSFNNIVQANRQFDENHSQRRMVSAYGEFRASYLHLLYLTVTGRNDWTSTLPVANRSYFYPSVSGSFVFTELLPKSDILSFGKLRASWAQVGKDAAPYVTNTYLWPSRDMLGGLIGSGNSWTRGNPYLKPEMTKSTELGVDLRFLNGRLGLETTYYTNNSFNQILSPRMGQSTGYIFLSVNGGDIYNKGLEVSLTGQPVKTNDFTWEATLNIAGNRGTVKNLIQGVDILYVTDVQVGNAKAASFNGGNFMAISGSKWTQPKDEIDAVKVTDNVTDQDKEAALKNLGKLKDLTILDEYGMPVSDNVATHEIGNREPAFTGGFNNSLQYKNWNLSFLFDFRKGGDIYNGTDYAMTAAGMSKRSMDRETLTTKGVVKTGTDAKGIPTYEEKSFTFNANETYNIKGVPTSGRNIIQSYWQTYYARESTNFMTDTYWMRLRTISLSYSLPQSLLNKVKVIKGGNLTVSGNNLFLLTNYKGMDPETSAAGSGVTGSSSVGIDYCGVPATAGVSFGINLTF
ncbi:SusC/RagA family TonB-linked outer membrane protein [Bacteroidia bacterium]|nr:SusC/RagA family TonB-linked outer membrane protein [Bacteroidia bacterium]